MISHHALRSALMMAAALALPACSKVERAVKSVQGRVAGPIDKGRLDAAIDRSMGGPDTCVVLSDLKSGGEAYRYGDNGAYMRELPPCSTFDIPLAIAALNAETVRSDQVVKWDGSPQPVKAWEKDADLKTAFKDSRQWYFRKAARDIGPDMAKALQALDYGNKKAAGPADRFWMGPSQGGQLAISTRGQAAFLRRLYNAQLPQFGPRPISPPAGEQVAGMKVDEIRSGSTISGKTGTCASNADGSRQVGWWVGRLQGPKGDYVFAASVEGQGSLPGLEVQTRLKGAFAQAGLWPDMPQG
jgi:beta-lactamase class D